MLSLTFKTIAVCHPQVHYGPFVLPATLKRVLIFFFGNLIHCYIMGFLFLYVLLYSCFIQPYCTYIISFCPKMAVPNLYFKFACLSNIIRLLLPLTILSRYCPYIAFLLYFGVNTIWYLHNHFVWLSESLIFAIYFPPWL